MGETAGFGRVSVVYCTPPFMIPVNEVIGWLPSYRYLNRSIWPQRDSVTTIVSLFGKPAVHHTAYIQIVAPSHGCIPIATHKVHAMHVRICMHACIALDSLSVHEITYQWRTRRRPGVAMTTCGLLASSLACCCMSRPPTMTQSCAFRATLRSASTQCSAFAGSIGPRGPTIAPFTTDAGLHLQGGQELDPFALHGRKNLQ